MGKQRPFRSHRPAFAKDIFHPGHYGNLRGWDQLRHMVLGESGADAENEEEELD